MKYLANAEYEVFELCVTYIDLDLIILYWNKDVFTQMLRRKHKYNEKLEQQQHQRF